MIITVNIAKIANHMRRFLLLYVFLAIISALPLGYHYAYYFKSHKELVKNAIVCLAIGTLYPSMIQLRAGKIGSELRLKLKETIVTLFIIFVITPAVAMFFANHIENRVIGIGYVAANAVPASSASIAYVMLAEGNIELATLLVILSILIASIAAPVYVDLYAKSVHVNLPIVTLAKSVTMALIVPLVLGQATRYYLVVRKARRMMNDPRVKLDCKNVMIKDSGMGNMSTKNEMIIRCLENRISARLKPILSIWTMTFMLVLIFLLIANKASLLISKPNLVLYILSAQIVVYAIVIISLLVASRALNIRYEDHMAAAFIALTKNQSVAATMTALATGPTAAIPAALIPAIQPAVAILYISASSIIKKALKA